MNRTDEELYDEACAAPIPVTSHDLESAIRAAALDCLCGYLGGDPHYGGRTAEALRNLKRANPRLAAIVRHILFNEGARP